MGTCARGFGGQDGKIPGCRATCTVTVPLASSSMMLGAGQLDGLLRVLVAPEVFS